MNHTPIINPGVATLLINPPNCATLPPKVERTIRVQDRCRNNRTTRQPATFTATHKVQCQ